MRNLPLNLVWKNLQGRSPDVEVITAPDSATMESTDGFADLTDHDLQERIKRVSKTVSTGIISGLPDGGKKLRALLRQLQDEQVRRESAQTSKAAGDCESGTQSNTESPSLPKDFSPNAMPSGSQSSFSRCLSDKADNAFSEELRFISGDKYKGSRENESQMLEDVQILSQPSTSCSRELSSQSFANKNREGCSKILRKRKSETKGSVDSEFKKVQDVVLLDDEDVESIELVQEDMTDEWMESKIYYPSRDDPESVEISYSDIKCLEPELFLSSTIMNFYIQYLQRSLSSIRTPNGKYLLFNTYFYKKLMEAMSSKSDRTACFSKLRRWWKCVNIFQKAYILLPIHGDMHWSLVIICIPAKEDNSGPIILHLDSLGLHDSSLIFDNVQSYLKEEWNYMKLNAASDLPISERIWRQLPRRIEKKKITVPQQKNEYDCGLFVLYFMERFIRDAPDRLRKKDLSMFSTKWFKPDEASGLRTRLRQLLIEEFDNSRVTDLPGSPAHSENEKSESRKEDSPASSERNC